MQRLLYAFIAAVVTFTLFEAASTTAASEAAEAQEPLFARENLVAWCIVPFDARKRGPEARAEMLSRMGIRKLAYDWRAEHIPTFDDEIETMKRWGIEITAWWFPAGLNAEAQAILDAIERHGIQPELWVSMGGGEIECTQEEHRQRVADHAAALRPIAEAAAKLGCRVGLYNHGGWFGEPENQLEIIAALNLPNVGIVYNLHHGHAHVDRFPRLLQQMLPHLYCLNLNGMEPQGEQIGKKIWPLGSGSLDLPLLRDIRESGYRGAIGILGHTEDDAELTLLDNLDGLEWLLPQLDGSTPDGPRPTLRVCKPVAPSARPIDSLSPAFGQALAGGMLTDGVHGGIPVTVELRARLHSKESYNILAASDVKASARHWEVFTEPNTGYLTLYAPGMVPDHVRSNVDVCDGEWHQICVARTSNEALIMIDGNEAARQTVQHGEQGDATQKFKIGLGQLVEGTLRMDGAIDDVRISNSFRACASGEVPLEQDDTTVGLWNFDDLPPASPSATKAEVEDAARRAVLPEYQIIPAATLDELTRAQKQRRSYYRGWGRSHGGNHNARYSPARQITRENVGTLAKAWEWRAGEAREGNVQCNPVVVDGVLYAPTSNEKIVALNAETGQELWQFDPGARPAFRGLVYWPGKRGHPARLLFGAGEYLWAVDPATGQPLETFGEGGRVRSGEARVAPAVHEDVLILPLFRRDVHGYDVRTGKHLWRFETIPSGDQYGADTWSGVAEDGANCWGGLALDDQRGIAYLSTGSPKPNFAGNTHHGQNLFANCVIALDALTGARLWHFQEIRHDIWDLDIPAPPNLVTVVREGRRIDAVAQTTKLGNTLLLDRVTGNPLFPVRFRRAPASTLPGERTWPYQPDIELPEPFARQEFTLDDVTERTASARAFVLDRLKNANMGWFAPFEEDKPTALYGIHGGAEWAGAAYDPETARLYVAANNVPWLVTVFRPDEVQPKPGTPPTRGELVYQEHCAQCHGADRAGVGMNPPLQGLGRRLDDAGVLSLLATGKGAMPAAPESVQTEARQALLDYLFLRDTPAGTTPPAGPGPLRYTHNGYPKLLDDEGYPGSKPPWGTLNCIDLNSGKIEWQVPLGTYPDLAMWGEDQTGAENFGGPSLTAEGLIFCAGSPDEMIRAFDADTGAILWEHSLPFGGYAAPSIYESGGRQFVVIAATGGGKLDTLKGDAWVAFALDTEASK